GRGGQAATPLCRVVHGRRPAGEGSGQSGRIAPPDRHGLRGLHQVELLARPRPSTARGDAGSVPRTVVPPPGDDPTSSSPPSAANRSAMLTMPEPRGTA